MAVSRRPLPTEPALVARRGRDDAELPLFDAPVIRMLSPPNHRHRRPLHLRCGGWALGIALALLLAPSCKPADEPARGTAEADAASTLFGPRDVGVTAPSGTVLVDRTRSSTPPVVEDLVGDHRADATHPTTAVDAVDGDGDPAAGDDALEGDRADAVGGELDAAVGDAAAEGDDTLEADLPFVVSLPDELVREVRAPVSARAEEEARRLNRVGLRKHRRLDLDAAMRDYLEALESWPGHPFSNYNLACAYALRGRTDEALRHLAILAAIGGDVERERLLSARVDPDFDGLHDDSRFRALTGFVPVWVSWSPSISGRADADRVAKALRASHIPARATATAWADEVRALTLLVRPDDAIARRMAREVRAAITVDGVAPTADAEARRRGLVEVERADLDARRPLVLVLPGRSPEPSHESPVDRDPTPNADARGDGGEVEDDPVSRPGPPEGPRSAEPVPGGEVVAGSGGEARSFSEIVGLRLVANADGTVGRLEFKPTGFFSWELVAPSGGRTLRRGRYALKGDVLSLTYREDREVPGDDPSAPELSFEENKQSAHPFVVAPDGLTLDGVRYVPR